MKAFIINRLTNASSWYGLIVLVCAWWLPRSAITVVAVVMLCMDDTRMQKAFADARAWLAEVWQ